MTEQWAPCPGFPDYEISSSGLVRCVFMVRGKTPGIIKPFTDHGYLSVKLRRDGTTVKAYIHRLVAIAFHSLDPEMEVDHRFHNRSDISQIRPATRVQNCWNTRGWKDHSSQYKGVSWSATKRKWFACIQFDGKTKSLGCHNQEEDAAKIYDQAAFAAWGEFAFLNFPDKFTEAAE